MKKDAENANKSVNFCASNYVAYILSGGEESGERWIIYGGISCDIWMHNYESTFQGFELYENFEEVKKRSEIHQNQRFCG